MLYTKYCKLNKPEPSDVVDIDVLNENMDKLDTIFNQIANQNLIIDGGFNVWQEGEEISVNSAGISYTATMWAMLLSDANGSYKLKKITNGAQIICENGGLSDMEFYQFIPFSYNATEGVSISFGAKASIQTNVKFKLYSVKNSIKTEIFAENYIISEDKERFSFYVNQDLSDIDMIKISVLDIENGMNTGEFIEISEVKLELGEASTGFCFENYYDSLKNTYPFFRRIKGLSTGTVRQKFIYSVNYDRICLFTTNVKLDLPFRITPTIRNFECYYACAVNELDPDENCVPPAVSYFAKKERSQNVSLNYDVGDFYINFFVQTGVLSIKSIPDINDYGPYFKGSIIDFTQIDLDARVY